MTLKKMKKNLKSVQKKQEQDYFKLTAVDWTRIPSFQEVESHIGTILGICEPEEKPAISSKGRPEFSLNSNDYIIHKGYESDDLVKKMYEDNGFETRFILQDPRGHEGPTVACPIGFPFNLPENCPDLQRFNRWICRVHVDIARLNNELVSIPHIEPDPSFHKLAHLWDTYILKHVVRGKTAVDILRFLGIK